jgi:hypothetical protein
VKTPSKVQNSRFEVGIIFSMQMKNIWKTGAWEILAGLFIAATTAQAQFTYTTNGGTIKITGYTGPGGDVTIPDTITELPVASIGDYAFNGMSSVSNITFPSTLIDIGHGRSSPVQTQRT